MALHLVESYARSAWRVVARWDSAVAGRDVAASYALARADGAGTTARVARAFLTDTLRVELALSEALVPGLLYALTFAGDDGAPQLAHRPPLAQTVGTDRANDPEAEAFGVDWDWLAPRLDATGDVPEVRGRACLVHDLAAIAVTDPGELFHRPDAGAALTTEVNGPTAAGALAAKVKREWAKDDRVRRLDVKVTVASTGEVTARGDVTPIALDEPLKVTARR